MYCNILVTKPFDQYFTYKFNIYQKSIQEINVDKVVSKQMMIYIQKFIKKKFKTKNNNKSTKKNKFYVSLHRTRKNFK